MYEWDDTKCETNRKSRGFGFEVIFEFDWDTAVVEEDVRRDYGEERFRAFGYAGDTLYAVAFTFRRNNIRIISLRRMRAKEGKRYGFKTG
ncbi:MAG: BrnT family toxin [Sneathiella sp.]